MWSKQIQKRANDTQITASWTVHNNSHWINISTWCAGSSTQVAIRSPVLFVVEFRLVQTTKVHDNEIGELLFGHLSQQQNVEKCDAKCNYKSTLTVTHFRGFYNQGNEIDKVHLFSYLTYSLYSSPPTHLVPVLINWLHSYQSLWKVPITCYVGWSSFIS